MTSIAWQEAGGATSGIVMEGNRTAQAGTEKVGIVQIGRSCRKSVSAIIGGQPVGAMKGARLISRTPGWPV